MDKDQTVQPIDGYQSFKDNNYGRKSKSNYSYTLREKLLGAKMSPEEARLVEQKKHDRAVLADSITDELEDEFVSVKRYADKCLQQGGLKGARMAISYIQSNEGSMDANKRLCDNLKVEY